MSAGVTALPGPPTVLTLHQVDFEPGSSRRFTATDGPLLLVSGGPEMTFASAVGPATIMRPPPQDTYDRSTLLMRPKELATPGAETELDNGTGIFLQPGAEGSVRNNGPDVAAVVVLGISSETVVSTASPD